MNIKEKENLKRIIKESHDIEVDILDKDSTFDFKCNACGACCTNSTIESIVFRAYDVFNLSIALNIKPSEVLRNYGNAYLGPTSGLPIIQLKSVALETPESMMNLLLTGKPTTVCPFLKNKRCSVHTHKPGSCRLYPLGRMVQTSNDDSSQDGKLETIYFLQKNTSCGDKGETHTIEEWLNGASKTENIFIEDSDFLSYISKIINLKKILDFVNSNPNSILRDEISSFYDVFTYYYYTNYNSNDSFESQFKENISKIKDLIDDLISIIQDMVSRGDMTKETADEILNQKS